MVSIIIINYNTFQLTCNCIESVKKHTRAVEYEVILVDNASGEHPAELFAEKFPDLKLIKNKNNTGFAKGNNLGIEHAKGDVILLLNSDTVLNDDAISKTAACLNAHQEIGVIGCRMTYPDGKIQHTARKFRSISWELLDLFRPGLFLFSYKHRAMLMLGKYFKADFDTSCDWLNGAFFMFTKEILNQLPGKKLDDRFFMYGEDQLWCWQIQQLGYKNYFYAGASIVHINSASTDLSGQLPLKKIMLKHELEIMKIRKGTGFYYYIFNLIFSCKEYTRYSIKQLVYTFSGKILR